MTHRLMAAVVAATLLVTGAALPLVSRQALAAPEPSRVPISWELNFKHGNLERIIVPVAGKDTPFWYMRYTVTNNSGQDILFTPNFEIVADTGTALAAFKDVPNDVFEKIKTLYKNPLMQSPTNIYGKLLQGDDNAKDGVIIFSALDPDARNFRIFVSGLSGETAEVPNPATKKPAILQKTLELDYNLPGQAIGIDPVSKLTATTWVMK
ncbi:MAG TPA: hypothetical protein VGN88_11850 [Phycisphaerae bacterium]